MTAGGEAAGRVSEDIVFQRLQVSRRAGDTVWRNQRLTSDTRNAEVDFLLGLPGFGFIVLEVKGGVVSVEGDAWIQESSGGYRKRINPMTQAREGMYGLRDYVEADSRWAGRGHARWGHAVVLPFSDVEDDFAMPDCPRHMIFGRGDLEDLVPRLAGIADRQRRDRRATLTDVALVGEILRGRGHATAETVAATDGEEPMRLLTEQQRAILDLTRVMGRIEIRGGPGSGKTFLALEEARRLSEEGARAALVCCSPGLAAFLTRATRRWPKRHRPAYVGTAEGLAVRTTGVTSRRRYDALVVDEAQDLPAGGWPALTAALREPGTGHLLILNDDRQPGLPPGDGMPECQVVLVLEHNLRNTRQIAGTLATIAPTRMRVVAADGPETRLVQCPTADAVATAERVVGELTESRWQPRDVALLTMSARVPACTSRPRVAEAAYWRSLWDGVQVFHGDVLGFKGLERAVVVLALDEPDAGERTRERLYVGLSRACEELVVCGDVRAWIPWAGTHWSARCAPELSQTTTRAEARWDNECDD